MHTRPRVWQIFLARGDEVPGLDLKNSPEDRRANQPGGRTLASAQHQALSALYRDIGFARSLLAYELPAGRLKLIDGHLRRDIDPDMEVDVEILDVTEEEARKLLLTIDPLASLAEEQDQLHQRLMEMTP